MERGPLDDELVALVSRAKAQDPPAWVLFEAIVDPFDPGARRWFDLRPDEQVPTIIEQERPSRVVWSSIWTDRPDLIIAFDIDGDDRGGRAGCLVRWTVLGHEGQIDTEDLRRRRYRLDQLVNGQLRGTFDQ